MANPIKPKRPKSRYAQKRAGTITPSSPGALRPLLHGLRLVAVQCTCGMSPITGKFDPDWLCGRCARVAATLSAPGIEHGRIVP